MFKNNRDGWNSFSDIINIGDNLIDLKRTRRLSGMQYARLIIRTFLELVFHDIIFNNVTFHFPMSGTVKLRIARNKNSKEYNIITFGNTYIPWLNFGWNFKKRTTGFYYYFILGKKWKEILLEEVKAGHTYRDGVNGEHDAHTVKDYTLIDKALEGPVTNIDKYI